MSFWDSFWQMIESRPKVYTSFYLPKHRVDVDYDATPINTGEAYCRIWLPEMRLARGVRLTTTRYPVVHAAVRFVYGDKLVTVPYLAGPRYLKELTDSNLDKVIQNNHPLSPLFPFNQGLIELEAGLFSMLDNDPIGKFIKTVERFSALLPVPDLSAALKLVGPVYGSIEDLLSIKDNRLELGYHQTFTPAGGGGSHDLRPGYFVAILAEENKVDVNTLCVVDDSLRIGSPGKAMEFINDHQALQGYSYMLFRIEKRKEQDWESLKSIRELVNQARKDTSEGKYQEVKKKILPAIRLAVYTCNDVTILDRKEMVRKIEAELYDWGLQSAQREVSIRSLYAIMQRPLPILDEETEAALVALEHLLGI